jgi:Uma2 family endonuclease
MSSVSPTPYVTYEAFLEAEEKSDTRHEAIINPTLVVEVLSESTEKYDRGEKFAHYMRLASVEQYVLVSQEERCIEVFRRPLRGHWEFEAAKAGETLTLHGRPISVDAVYA